GGSWERGDHSGDRQDAESALEVVGEHGQAELRLDALETARQEVALVHCSLDRPEGMFHDGLASTQDLRRCRNTSAHLFDEVLYGEGVLRRRRPPGGQRGPATR